MHSLANDRASHNTNTTAPTLIHVTTFQPFESRIGIDHVMRLDFAYDPELIAHLKRLLAGYKTAAVDPAHNRHAPGGFLPKYRCWFLEPCIWDAVKLELSFLGYRIHEVPS